MVRTDVAVTADPRAEPPGAGQPWTVLRMILWSAGYLEDKGIGRARLDAEYLLAHVLGLSRLDLYLQYERPLTSAELDGYRPLLVRRVRREPLQYVLGSAAFRSLTLSVDSRVLIPRPETEELVQAVLDWCGARGVNGSFLDLGTGSGAIALSLLEEGSFERGVASDVSKDALAVARGNAEAVGHWPEFRCGSLFEVVGEDERFDVLVSNPPYVRSGERQELAPEVCDHEPASALFAGDQGLDVIVPVVRGAAAVLEPGGLLCLEIGSEQGPAVLELLRSEPELRDARVRTDLSGRDRIAMAERVPVSHT